MTIVACRGCMSMEKDLTNTNALVAQSSIIISAPAALLGCTQQFCDLCFSKAGIPSADAVSFLPTGGIQIYDRANLFGTLPGHALARRGRHGPGLPGTATRPGASGRGQDHA